jgi:predicted membrane-bound spermidine synthase
MKISHYKYFLLPYLEVLSSRNTAMRCYIGSNIADQRLGVDRLVQFDMIDWFRNAFAITDEVIIDCNDIH